MLKPFNPIFSGWNFQKCYKSYDFKCFAHFFPPVVGLFIGQLDSIEWYQNTIYSQFDHWPFKIVTRDMLHWTTTTPKTAARDTCLSRWRNLNWQASLNAVESYLLSSSASIPTKADFFACVTWCLHDCVCISYSGQIKRCFYFVERGFPNVCLVDCAMLCWFGWMCLDTLEWFHYEIQSFSNIPPSDRTYHNPGCLFRWLRNWLYNILN